MISIHIDEQIQHHVNEPGVPDLQNEVLKLEICYDLSEEICKFHRHLANKGFLSSGIHINFLKLVFN